MKFNFTGFLKANGFVKEGNVWKKNNVEIKFGHDKKRKIAKILVPDVNDPHYVVFARDYVVETENGIKFWIDGINKALKIKQ